MDIGNVLCTGKLHIIPDQQENCISRIISALWKKTHFLSKHVTK